MTDSKIRLGTFRIHENIWKEFVAKAHSNGDNASSILLNTVHAYLNSEVNSPSPAIAISTTPTLTNPSSNTAKNAPPTTPVIAISSSLPLPIPTNSTVSILLAIAPDNQILYIDRGIPQHWNPPYHLRNTNADYRLEFLTASDSSILSPIEDILVKTFKPPFNFKTNLYGHVDVDADVDADVDVDQLSQPSAIASLAKITDRISAIEDNLIQLQLQLKLTNSQKPTTAEPNTDTTPQNQNQTKTKPKSLTVDPKPKPLPLPLKGTASVKELPSPLGTTELAQRLNISVKRLEKVRSQYKNSTEGFFKYTLNKENGKFGWIYDPKKQLHIPYIEVPTPITPINAATAKEMQTLPNPSNPSDLNQKSESTKKPNPQLLPNLNQSQLANRFGINPSTLSRKRSGFLNGYISAQDFDSWCRSKDPDNLLWTFSEHSQHYTCKP